MRIIKYPEPEEEAEINCVCGARLAYTQSDCFWKNGVAGDIKFIKCPLCGREIRVDYIPYPQNRGQFYWGI